jgi:hypothetical protein
MAGVYSNAVCTLAADSAEDSTQGCRVGAGRITKGLKPVLRDGREYFDLDLDLDLDVADGRMVRILKDVPKAWMDELGEVPTAERTAVAGWNPLRWRAWAFQERELSGRVVHFSENMLLWECRTMRGSCELPWEERPSYGENQYPKAPIPNVLGEDMGPGGASELRVKWFGDAEEYSARALTREEDRLPALAGLACRFQQSVPNSEYLFGLWSEHLPAALLWKSFSTDSSRPVRRPGAARAPTWSWPSVEGGISYHSQRVHAPGSHLGRALHEAEKADDHKWYSDVLSWSFEPSSSGPYMGGENCRMVLRGLIVPLTVRERRFRYIGRARSDLDSPLLDGDGVMVGTMFHDVPYEVHAQTRVFCIAIRSEPQYAADHEPEEGDYQPQSCLHSSNSSATRVPSAPPQVKSPKVMGLAIVEEDGEEGAFRRVGLVRWLREAVLSEARETTITLV